jgi:Protein of unknown function (DUF3892)
MATEITCVLPEHRGADSRIERRLGGPGWVKDESTVIAEVEEGRHYFVEVASAHLTVVVAVRGNSKYLRTDPDSSPENNLNFLPACP